MKIDYCADDFDIRSLGSFYSKEKTVFRVFAPDYEKMELQIGGHAYLMHRKDLCFEIALASDLELFSYHYIADDKVVFRDPFAYCSRGEDSLIMDPSKFLKDRYEPKGFDSPIIYECSVRDFSSDPSYPGRYRKKFLSFTEAGLRNDRGLSIGLDYLKELGITHLQLMPVFDFDDDKGDYNWGYNPRAYNYVKDLYVEDPEDPYHFVNELRQTVNVLHQNDIRVVLDVVFNHVYRYRLFDLGRMLKGRLYRYKKDGKLAEGTFVGNEVASEDPFVRAYILEMVGRYLDLFDIDGIRMDLMGISDYETVNLILEKMREKKKDFIVYGEGWNMGDVLPEEERASIPNAEKMPGVAMFNDHFRETMIHYISGNTSIDEEVCKALSCGASYLDGRQSINYVECHDDYTFFDRMMIYKSDDRSPVNEKRCRMALALVMLSKGIPFIHAGEEFLRTKNGIRNSYNAPDEINRIDWNRRDRYAPDCRYLKQLIDLRKKYRCLSDPDGKMLFECYEGFIVFRTGELTVIINPSDTDKVYHDGSISSVIFDEMGSCDRKTDEITVPAYCVVICERE